MKLTPRMQKGGALVLAGLFGWTTGQWLPPEVFGQLLGAFV